MVEKRFMLRIAWISAVLLLVGAAACEISLDVGAAAPHCQSAWRRTRDGWTRQESLQPQEPVGPPRIHPLLVAAALALAPLRWAAWQRQRERISPECHPERSEGSPSPLR
jgi:hypothetical protein